VHSNTSCQQAIAPELHARVVLHHVRAYCARPRCTTPPSLRWMAFCGWLSFGAARMMRARTAQPLGEAGASASTAWCTVCSVSVLAGAAQRSAVAQVRAERPVRMLCASCRQRGRGMPGRVSSGKQRAEEAHLYRRAGQWSWASLLARILCIGGSRVL
jgi:hypothetical protein